MKFEYLTESLKIIAKPKSIIIITLSTALVVAIAAWLPNINLIINSLFNESLDLKTKLKILLAFAGAIKTNFNNLARIMIVLSAVISGIQIALIIYYWGDKISANNEAGIGVLGMISSLLGVGCASCGSVVLTSVLGLSATSGIIAFLPWHGVEFAVIGLVIISISTLITAKKLYETKMCKIKSR